MPKLPWMQFNTGDWLKDPNLSMCAPATRGIWIDALCAMHEAGRYGALSGTPDQLSRVLRCSESALHSAINDLIATGAADITKRNSIITLNNRRMQREAKEREDNRLRQDKYRGKKTCHGENNGKVTPLYDSDSISDSFSEKKKGCGEKEKQYEDRELFDEFWKAYPRNEAKKPAWELFQRLKPDKSLLSAMLAWLTLAKKSEQWQDPALIPHAKTWLSQRRWEDEPPPQPSGRRIQSTFRPADIQEYNPADDKSEETDPELVALQIELELETDPCRRQLVMDKINTPKGPERKMA